MDLNTFMKPYESTLHNTQTDYLASIQGATQLQQALTKIAQNLFRPEIEKYSQARGQQAAEYYAAPSKTREMFAGVENPLQREALADKFMATALKPYVATTSLLDYLKQGANNNLSAMLSNEAANRAFLKERMGIAQNAYNMGLNQFNIEQSAQDRAWNRAFKEKQFEYEKQQNALANKLAWYKATQSSANSSKIPTSIIKDIMDRKIQFNSTKATIDSLKNAWQSVLNTSNGVGFWAGIIRNIDRGDKEASNYNKMRNALLASLRSITGDKGILTDQDAARIIGWLPSISTPKEVAEENWKRIYNLLQIREQSMYDAIMDMEGL